MPDAVPFNVPRFPPITTVGRCGGCGHDAKKDHIRLYDFKLKRARIFCLASVGYLDWSKCYHTEPDANRCEKYVQ